MLNEIEPHSVTCMGAGGKGDMHVCVHACMYLYVFGVGHRVCLIPPRHGILPNLGFALFFSWLVWLVSEPQRCPVSTSPGLRSQVHSAVLGHLHGCWGFELGFSCLQSECSCPLAILQPDLIVLKTGCYYIARGGLELVITGYTRLSSPASLISWKH